MRPLCIELPTICPKRPKAQDRSRGTETTEYFRRHVLAVGAGTGAMMLAGCSTDTTESDPDGGGSSPDDTESGASADGTFRLLISDRPASIDDFDELNVSFDRSRIFAEDAEETGETTDGTETELETEDDEPEDGENNTEDETEAETEDSGADDGDQRGFHIIDLDEETVDLTQVVGDKAIDVFEGNFEEGRYTKVELYAADVEGIVEGESADVQIPSGKLQIVKPFEIVAGETLSFVFDINVVKKGQRQEYNLLPVISESGVAGEDVDVEEVDTEATDATEAQNGTDTADETEE